MQKVMYGIIASLFITLSFIFWKYISALKELEHETYKNLMLESKLDTQNKEIQKIKLETNQYKENKVKQELEIKNKYDKVANKAQKVYINTCDIKEYERLKKQELTLKELLKVRYK